MEIKNLSKRPDIKKISDIVKNKYDFYFYHHPHFQIEYPLNPLHCLLTRDVLRLTLYGDLDSMLEYLTSYHYRSSHPSKNGSGQNVLIDYDIH